MHPLAHTLTHCPLQRITGNKATVLSAVFLDFPSYHESVPPIVTTSVLGKVRARRYAKYGGSH